MIDSALAWKRGPLISERSFKIHASSPGLGSRIIELAT
jgi:hypothetical protein